VATPAANDLVYLAGNHILVLDNEIATHGEVMKGLRRLRDGYVEPSEVAATVAAVSMVTHSSQGSRGPRASFGERLFSGLVI
jgi:hypothetical protein